MKVNHQPAARSPLICSHSPATGQLGAHCSSLARNPFIIRTYEKSACIPFRIRTYKTQDLKPFRMNTCEKTGEGEGIRDG